jgi:hypothetical protein
MAVHARAAHHEDKTSLDKISGNRICDVHDNSKIVSAGSSLFERQQDLHHPESALR